MVYILKADLYKLFEIYITSYLGFMVELIKEKDRFRVKSLSIANCDLALLIENHFVENRQAVAFKGLIVN